MQQMERLNLNYKGESRRCSIKVKHRDAFGTKVGNTKQPSKRKALNEFLFNQQEPNWDFEHMMIVLNNSLQASLNNRVIDGVSKSRNVSISSMETDRMDSSSSDGFAESKGEYKFIDEDENMGPLKEYSPSGPPLTGETHLTGWQNETLFDPLVDDDHNLDVLNFIPFDDDEHNLEKLNLMWERTEVIYP